jgi:hypothetical protein
MHCPQLANRTLRIGPQPGTRLLRISRRTLASTNLRLGLLGSVLSCSFGAAITRLSIGACHRNKPLPMENLDHVARPSSAQKRKHRRFSLQYPVRLKAHSGDRVVQVDAMSRNISIRGLLMETSLMIPQNTPVSFILTVEPSELGCPIQFMGVGKVVRVDPKPAEDGFAIAVECPQRIIQSRP